MWEWVQIITSTVVVFTVPFYAAFAPESDAWWLFHTLVDCLFLCDIYVKLHTA